ncbi:C3a anaphylatoxin chemotactic receptor [Phodopus roborovskii]|uniref:C3a anaphylatoxin chemotactic receptor n=1 Tax=Phodopus roborovskii TaxID=109678 RepID=A0AAV0ACV2_PHORO|nr:C3a anaphylatoxin chemotactic receptor [Phodopus roborovskii]CAH7416156.1 C3ar1 [Phodopus roborovskii]
MESFSADTNSTDPHSPHVFKPQDILSMLILCLTCLLGLPGNGLVLWVAGLKMKRTVNTVWFLHLTLADFLCCLSLPFSLAHLILQGYWPYGLFLCKLIPSIIVLNMFASVFLLTAISLDRCLMVHKPIWCQNHRNVRTALTICGCVWAVAFVMCVPVFVYRDLFTINNHSVCGYNFDSHRDFDYWDYNGDLPESNSTDNSTVQLTGQIDDRSDPSSSQISDHLQTAVTALQSQTLQGSSEDSFPLDSARLSRQQSHYSVKPPSVLMPAIPTGFPVEDHRASTHRAHDFLSAPIEPFATASSNYISHPEHSQDFQDDYSAQFMYHEQTPMVAITITRLVVGFLVPLFIMTACYSLIVFRMRKANFTKSRSKTFRVALVVVTVFFVCWTPYHIVGVLLLIADSETPLREAALSWDHMSIALASANSCFNPFLYALLGKDFRKKAKQSIKGILEAAFSEELTHSTNYTQDKASSKGNNLSTDV